MFCLFSTLGSKVWSMNLINWLHLIPPRLLTPRPCPTYAAMAYRLDKWTVLYFNSSVFYLCLMIATILRITQRLHFVHFVWLKNKHNSVATTKQNRSHTQVKGNCSDPKTSCSLFRTVRQTRSRHTTIWSVMPRIPTAEHLQKLTTITLRGLSPRANYTDRAAAAFADRGVSRGQRNGSPRPLIFVFWTRAATFLFK